MNKYRKNQFVVIVALLMAIVGMSMGFATNSSSLVISSSAIVKPDSSTFRVVFSTMARSLDNLKINGVASAGATAGTATISNDGDTPKISDITATFTEPGQSVTYTFYSYNAGAYTAYLNKIIFDYVEGYNSSKICTAVDATNAASSLMNSACADINVSIKVGDLLATNSLSDISNHTLDKSGFEPVVITISYENNNNFSNGDFVVEFGDISLQYSSAN